MMKSMIMQNGVTFMELEKNIYAWVCQIGRRFTKEFLERYDRMLMESRDKKKYRNKGMRQTTVKTVYGEVTYQRTVYEVTEGDGTRILKGASGNGKTYIACALGNAACRRFKKVQYIRMPELLDELSIARSGGTLKKVLEAYKKKDLLILDEWLIRPLSPQESYDMLEIVEARCHKSTIFCTQYESEGWYTRIDPNPESDSPVSEAIMDRIIHNAYEVLVDGRVSMRERKGLKAAREGGGQDA